jgi:hypothetical protein
MSSSCAVTDEVIRASISALSSAGIHLTVRHATVTSASGSSSAADAAGGTGSGTDDDGASTS